MIKIKTCLATIKIMYVVVIYKRNQRTAWGRGLSTLPLCFFTRAELVVGGVGNQRVGLSGVSSLTLVWNSRIALCLWGLRTIFSGTFIPARPLANTDHPTDSNPLRWRSISLTKSTMWDPEIGLFSYTNSLLSFQCNTSRFSLILSNSCLVPVL